MTRFSSLTPLVPKGAPPSSGFVDVNRMAEDARDRLGWDGLTNTEAAALAHVRQRTWVRYKPGAKGRMPVPPSVIYTFWTEVGLSVLYQAEQGGDEAVEALLGGPLTVLRVSSFLASLWAPWLPGDKT